MLQINQLEIVNSNFHYSLYPFDYFLKIQKEVGINKIELWGSVPHIYIDHTHYEDPTQIKKELNRYNIKIVAFTPKPYKYSLCAPYETKQRKATLTYYKNCIDFAIKLGVDRICIDCTGGNFDMPDEMLWNCCKDSLIHLCQIAKSKGVTIVISTVYPYTSKILTTLHELKKMIDCVASKSLKILLDTFILSKAGETINQWFEVFGSDIIHTHFADGRNNGYGLWGKGCFPMKRYLDDLYTNGYTGYLGQKLLNQTYFNNPAEADRQNLAAMRKYNNEEGDNNGTD